MTDRRRNLFILLLVAGLLLASLVVIFTKPTRLGLDLQGGVELVYEGKPTPQQPEVNQEALDRAVEIMRERVDQLGVAEPEIQRSGRNQISVGLPNVTNAERAQRQVGKVAQLFFYDWEPNVIGPEGRPDPTNQQVTEVPLPTLYQAVERASKRPLVKRQNASTGSQWYLFGPNKQLLAGPEETRADLFSELPGKEPPKGSTTFLVKQGTVVVKAERPDNFPKDQPYNRYYVLNDNPELSGTDLKDPEQNFDNGPGGGGQPIVTFNFTGKGRSQFQKVTRRVADRGRSNAIPGQPPQASFQHFAAVLDNEVITRPFISYVENPDGIDGRNGAQISGGFTISGAQDLARSLKTGALPIKLELISQSQVSATLGKQALNEGLIAGAVGFLIVVLFLIVFYRVLGVIAAGALVVYGIYFFAIIKLIPITLTLPGIAGLVLTIGVAADANIVIFERVKEEVRAGRSIPAGIAAGYKKGLSAIIDANVVTIMVAFILFVLATAGVKGFAFTLGVGTLVSLFTAVLATSAILGTLSRSKMLSRPSALGVGTSDRSIKFDFMGASRWFFSMSGVILLIGALAIGGKGLNFGIEFEGGTRITTNLRQGVDENDVRNVMAAQGFADAKIQRVDNDEIGDNAFQVSTEDLEPDKLADVRGALVDDLDATNFSNTTIGPTFGETVANSALVAIVASLLVISAYIALRFEWKYAVPVLIAVMHDILITAGVYSLTGREVTVSTVAALLTILGFSLYDTIIVFDRIRENVQRMPRAAFSQIVNRSMSEVIVRSLATSLCTLLPVLSLYLFGGETLKDFAFALIVGILSGAYSSVFIASPVLTHWKEREQVYRRRADRIRRENNGLVPAYAMAGRAGEPIDIEPEKKKRFGRRDVLGPDGPPEVSKEEFEELVRDIQDEEPKPEPPPRKSSTARSKPQRPAPKPKPPPVVTDEETNGADATDGAPGDGDGAAEVTPAPDFTAEEVDAALGRPPKDKSSRSKRAKNRRHGRPR